MERLDDTDPVKGYLDLNRAKLPTGDRLVAQQIGSMIYDASGAINSRTFSTTMARLGSTDRPLRLFSEAGRWASNASSQPPRAAYESKVKGAYEEWNHRWILDFFDSANSRPTAYAVNKSSAGVMSAVVPDLSDVFDMRQLTRVEAAGTRTALGVVGFRLVSKDWPPVVTAIRPRFMKEMDLDPYNATRAHGARPALEYFVPNREINAGGGRTEGKEPHEVILAPRTGGQGITVRLREDVFVLYSVGPDGGPNRAKRVQNTAKLTDPPSDYLLWPPVVSLQRQYLMDKQLLK